jgi:hypothetical protein
MADVIPIPSIVITSAQNHWQIGFPSGMKVTTSYFRFCERYVDRYVGVGHSFRTIEAQLRQHLLALFVRGVIKFSEGAWDLDIKRTRPKPKLPKKKFPIPKFPHLSWKKYL